MSTTPIELLNQQGYNRHRDNHFYCNMVDIGDVYSMFIVKETDNGMIVEFWGVLHGEETLICNSNYVSRLTYKRSIDNIRYNALHANIEDRTFVGFVKLKSPKIVLDIKDEIYFYFYLKARNGTILTRSTAFTCKQTCLYAIECFIDYSIFDGRVVNYQEAKQ